MDFWAELLHELTNWNEYSKLLVGLLALTDPIGNLPFITSLTQSLEQKDKVYVIRTALLVFVIAMLIFTFLGEGILNLFGISPPALRIAGGIYFLFYGLEMLGVISLPEGLVPKETPNPRLLGVVPIGIPFLAGPGPLSNIIIYANIHEGLPHKILVCLVIFSVAAIVYLIFRSTLIFGKHLNETTSAIIIKVMGLILSGVAIEFILVGIADFYPAITLG